MKSGRSLLIIYLMCMVLMIVGLIIMGKHLLLGLVFISPALVLGAVAFVAFLIMWWRDTR